MEKQKFQFGNTVVVEKSLIGLIVKSWGPSISDKNCHYEVYVRAKNKIVNYRENEIIHYVYSKELSEEELEFH